MRLETFGYDPLQDPLALRSATPAMVARIYERFGPDLARLIGRIVLDRETTLNCLQDLFADLPVRLRETDEDLALGPWLQRQATALALAELCGRHRWHKLRRWFRNQVGRLGPRERRELVSIRDAGSLELEAALRGAAPLERAVLVLESLEGHGDASAAALLGIPIRTARALHKRVRARLQQQLASLDGDRGDDDRDLDRALRGLRRFPPPPLWELLARGRRPPARRAPRLALALVLASVASFAVFVLAHGVTRAMLPLGSIELGANDRIDRTGLPFTGTVATPDATIDLVEARFHVEVEQLGDSVRTRVRLISGAATLRREPPVPLPVGGLFETEAPGAGAVRPVK